MDLTALKNDLTSALSKIESFVGSQSGAANAPTLIQKLAELQTLHTQLGSVEAADTATIGKILVAIGGVIAGFFPNWAQYGTFLITLGTALEQGGQTGTVGPIRIGSVGLTISWAPWTGEQPGTFGDVAGSGSQTAGGTPMHVI